MIAILALVVGIAAGLLLRPNLPAGLTSYIPVVVVAALDTVLEGIRARLEGGYHEGEFVVAFLTNSLLAAFVVWVGDRFGGAGSVDRDRGGVRGADVPEPGGDPPVPVPGMSVLEPVGRWPERRGPTMRPPSRLRTRIAAAVVAGGVGLLVGIQAGESGTDRIGRLAQERPEDLTSILADLNAEADRLARQVAELRVRLERYRDAATGSDVALRDARQTLRDLEVLSGTVPVEGPGVSVTISDPSVGVGWDLVLDLVQELREAGAEALAIDGVRVGASTWLGPTEGGLLVDGQTVRPPYEIVAIGPPEPIRDALGIAGGPLTVIEAQPMVSVGMLGEASLTVPALREEMGFEYARPIS